MKSKCLECEIEMIYAPSQRAKYCSVHCQQIYQRKQLLEAGIITAKSLRAHLIWKYGAKCSLCGWNEINSSTGKCPIEIDHIDGNSDNNTEENCRLICPNCHSLTPTFKALNKGKGRKSNRLRYHKKKTALMAQLDSAIDFYSMGWGFESLSERFGLQALMVKQGPFKP